MGKAYFGAEAEIHEKKGRIIKRRVNKAYRHPHIDLKLRKARNQREYRLLEKLCSLGLPVPRPLRMWATSLSMEKVQGMKVRDALTSTNIGKICPQIGRLIAELHNRGIIHGDLTTSNMILSKGKVFLIDFGLSFYSQKHEDKAVDLHLLWQALSSRHWKVTDKAFPSIIAAYKKSAWHCDEVFERFAIVQGRGRYKGKRHAD